MKQTKIHKTTKHNDNNYLLTMLIIKKQTHGNKTNQTQIKHTNEQPNTNTHTSTLKTKTHTKQNKPKTQNKTNHITTTKTKHNNI